MAYGVPGPGSGVLAGFGAHPADYALTVFGAPERCPPLLQVTADVRRMARAGIC